MKGRKPVLTKEQQREIRHLASQGYAARAIASMLKLPRDAVTLWLADKGLAGSAGASATQRG